MLKIATWNVNSLKARKGRPAFPSLVYGQKTWIDRDKGEGKGKLPSDHAPGRGMLGLAD